MCMTTIIGLTGNIATGKSTLMRLAAERGAYTLDADKVVHDVLAHDKTVKMAIRAEFGDSVFDANGNIVRSALGNVVFADKAALKRLEVIVLPATRDEIARRLENADAEIIMVEAIKLLESPVRERCDQIWVTFCSRYNQIERLMQFRDMSRTEAEQRISAQPPQEEKIAHADVVIDTNGDMARTILQFERAWTDVE